MYLSYFIHFEELRVQEPSELEQYILFIKVLHGLVDHFPESTLQLQHNPSQTCQQTPNI